MPWRQRASVVPIKATTIQPPGVSRQNNDRPRQNQRNQIRRQMGHSTHVAKQLSFLGWRPATTISTLHQQRHHAARHHQFSDDPPHFAPLRGKRLAPPARKCRDGLFGFGHGQLDLVSKFRTPCQLRQTKNPRRAQRQARCGRATTTAVTAAAIAKG